MSIVLILTTSNWRWHTSSLSFPKYDLVCISWMVPLPMMMSILLTLPSHRMRTDYLIRHLLMTTWPSVPLFRFGVPFFLLPRLIIKCLIIVIMPALHLFIVMMPT